MEHQTLSRLSQRPSDPVYYIEDCRISKSYELKLRPSRFLLQHQSTRECRWHFFQPLKGFFWKPCFPVWNLTKIQLFHTGSDSIQITTLTACITSGYEKWYRHFYTCQINKGDIWLQFENNEKIHQVALSYRKIKNKY